MFSVGPGGSRVGKRNNFHLNSKNYNVENCCLLHFFFHTVSNWLRCQIDLFCTLGVKLVWCQIGPAVKLTPLHSSCQIGTGVKLTPLHSWCQIVLSTLLVSNLLRCQIGTGVKLSSNLNAVQSPKKT